jgi:hypothetical protein
MVVRHLTKIISDYNHDIWKYQGLDEQHPTKLGLEAYMANALRLSSR